MTIKPNNIDEYIANFPKDVQEILQQVRATIANTAPDADETISYAIPTFTLDKVSLVHFAAFKNHIGFYPTPTGGEAFKEELSHYKTGKGSVQFTFNRPIPFDLITRIVKFRMEEIRKQAMEKVSKKK